MKLLKNLLRSKTIKKLLKIVVILLFSIVFLSLILSTVLYTQQDKLTKFFVTQINSYLISKVDVEKIDFSFLSTFPMAAVHFTNVKGQGSNKNDPNLLFELEKVSLKFSIWDLFKKNYLIRQIVCNDGYINIKYYEDESDNFHIIKPKNSMDSGFSFSLQKILGKNCLFQYIDLKSGYDYRIFFSNLQAKGNLDAEEQDISLNGHYIARSLTQKGKELIINKQGDINVDIFHIMKTKTISFSGGRLSLDGLKFKTSAKICYQKGRKYMDINVNGDKISIKDFTSLAPKEYTDLLSEYKYEGIVDFNLNMIGDFSLPTPLRYQMIFQYNNGKIKHLPTGASLDNINMKGKYDNGKEQSLKSSTLLLSPLSASLDDGNISGYFSISNLESPYVTAKAKLDINLEKLNDFMGLRNQQMVSGNLKLDFDYKNQFSSLSSISKDDFLKSICNGTAIISNFAYYREQPMSISLQTSLVQLKFTNKNIEVEPCEIVFNRQKINMESEINNIFPYLFLSDETLFVQGKINSPSINTDAFLNSSSKQKVGFIIPHQVFVNLDVACKHFQHKNIQLKNFQSKLLLSPSKCVISDAKMQAFGGNLQADIDIYRLNQDLFQLTMDGKTEKVNLAQMLKSLDDLGQENITHENISGLLTNDIKFYINYSLKEGFDVNSLVLWTKMNISKGQLINLKGLDHLSKFTGENDLNNLKFADLNNTIQIEKGIITIPLMEINTNLLGIKFAGTHTFNNEIDYDLFIELSEILSLRRKKIVKDEELGFVNQQNKNKLILPIHIGGTLSNPIIEYDFKKLKIQFKSVNPISIENASAQETQNKINQARWKELEKGKFIIDDCETETNNIPTKPNSTPIKTRTQLLKEEEAKKQSKEFKISFEDN